MAKTTTIAALTLQLKNEIESKATLTSSQQCSTRAIACLEQFPTAEKLLMAYTPAHQIAYTADVRRVFTTDKAPRLDTMAEAYGHNAPAAWLVGQLADLAEFSGAKGKLDEEQLKQTAWVIYKGWHRFNLAELMLFFVQFKQGKYGRFYGNADPMVVTEAIAQFEKEREEQRVRFQREEQKERDAKERAFYEHLRNCYQESGIATRAEYFAIQNATGCTDDDMAAGKWKQTNNQ